MYSAIFISCLLFAVCSVSKAQSETDCMETLTNCSTVFSFKVAAIATSGSAEPSAANICPLYTAYTECVEDACNDISDSVMEQMQTALAATAISCDSGIGKPELSLLLPLIAAVFWSFFLNQ